MSIKEGTRIRIIDAGPTRAWGHVGEEGVGAGPDPKGINESVVQVKLDSGYSFYERNGINKMYIEEIAPVNLCDSCAYSFGEREGLPERTVRICGLLHDVCKVGRYVRGHWQVENDWSYADAVTDWRHAERSLEIIRKFITLQPIEETIIRYHMDPYGTVEFDRGKGAYTFAELLIAQDIVPVKLFYFADEQCTLREPRY